MGHLKIYLLVCMMSMITIEARTELDWKNRATTLLCNHPGSRSDKVTKIRKELHSTYPDFSFYISVMNEDVDLTYHTDNDNSSEYQPSGAGGTRSPPATPHCMPVGPKMADRVCKGVYP